MEQQQRSGEQDPEPPPTTSDPFTPLPARAKPRWGGLRGGSREPDGKAEELSATDRDGL